MDNSIFKANTLVESTITRNSGLIFTDMGGRIVVNNSLFIDNSVNTTHIASNWDGLHAVINANDVGAFPDIVSIVNVENSCFVRNKGISFSLVFGAVWGGASMNSKNNYASGNSYLDPSYKSCGIGQLYMNTYYDYFGYYNLSTGICQKTFSAASCSSFPNLLGNGATVPSSDPTSQAVGYRVNIVATVTVPLLLIAFSLM